MSTPLLFASYAQNIVTCGVTKPLFAKIIPPEDDQLMV